MVELKEGCYFFGRAEGEGMDPTERTTGKSDVRPGNQEVQHRLRNPIAEAAEEEEEEGMEGDNSGLELGKVGETNAGKHLDMGSSEGKKLSHAIKDGSIHLWIPTATRCNRSCSRRADHLLCWKCWCLQCSSCRKAREIMLSAAAAAKPDHMKNNGTDCAAASPVLKGSPSLQSTATALASPQSQLYPAQKSFICKLQAELPIARRHSLQRFFEKRWDRLVSKAPYPTPSATMTDNTKTNQGAEDSPELGCFNTSK